MKETIITSIIISILTYLAGEILKSTICFIRKLNKEINLSDDLATLLKICKRYKTGVYVVSEKHEKNIIKNNSYRVKQEFRDKIDTQPDYFDSGFCLIDRSYHKINVSENCSDLNNLMKELLYVDLIKLYPYPEEIPNNGNKFSGHKCYGFFKIK